MKVTRSKEMEAWALKKIKEHLQARPRSDKGWHVSDLLYARKTFWRKIDPRPMTDEEALYFVAGHGHHNILEACLGKRDAKERSDAGEFQKYGIFFSPDMRMKNFTLEIKTSRARKIAADVREPIDVYDGYLKQENSYQALMKQDRGALLVLFLNAVKDEVKESWKTRPQLRCYKILMDAKERKKHLTWLFSTAKSLTEAVKKKTCSKLPLCPIWLCKDCVWFKGCKPWLMDPKRKNIQEGR